VDFGEMTPLFDAALRFSPDAPATAVIHVGVADDAYIGSGNGTVMGERLRGTIAWSLHASDCLYPRIRRGEVVPDDLHRCSLSFRGLIDTADGARVQVDGRGYGLRTVDWYRWSLTLAFGTNASPYRWLTATLAAMQGEFDEKAARAVLRAFAPVGFDTPARIRP
jgi:hypothetical protein